MNSTDHFVTMQCSAEILWVQLTCTIHANTVAYQVPPSWQRHSPTKVPKKLLQEWLKECDKALKTSTGSPNSPHPNLIEHLWDMLGTPPHNPQDSKDPPLTPWCQTPQGTPRGPMSVPLQASTMSNPRRRRPDSGSGVPLGYRLIP